jgi:predicted glutamine amidotransferase
MCRWLAYSGTPVLLEELLYKPKHSLIDQSLHSQLGVETTNGDGFGVGWYDGGEIPAVYKNTEPAWNDWNLRELAGHIRSVWYLRTSVHRQAHQYSRPIATLSATANGFGCTTARSRDFRT